MNEPFLEASYYETFQQGICIPAEILLQALNVTKVDFFSLDVENAEVEVLQNFPFDRITVDVWMIEHINPNLKLFNDGSQEGEFEDESFIEFMENKGYYLFDLYCVPIPDYSFIRIGSDIFRKLEIPKESWKRKSICKDAENGKAIKNYFDVQSKNQSRKKKADKVYKQIPG